MIDKILNLFVDNKSNIIITIVLLVINYICYQYFKFSIPQIIWQSLGTILVLYGIYNYVFRCD